METDIDLQVRAARLSYELDSRMAELRRLVKETPAEPVLLDDAQERELAGTFEALQAMLKSADAGTLVRGPGTSALAESLLAKAESLIDAGEQAAKKSS